MANQATSVTPSEDYDPSQFIRSVEWRFAKTMAHYNPHWYVVERDHRGAAFDAFVAFVRSGPIRRYKGGRYHCATVDEWDYFLTRARTAGSSIANRATPRAGTHPRLRRGRARRSSRGHEAHLTLMRLVKRPLVTAPAVT
jgi:hypothetical protein